MSTDETETALLPLDEGDNLPAALLALYHDMPGDVVAVCEAQRHGMLTDVLARLRIVRATLAPYGKFKEWCEAMGWNYGTVKNRLSLADRKLPNNEPLPGSLADEQTEWVDQDFWWREWAEEAMDWACYQEHIRLRRGDDAYYASWARTRQAWGRSYVIQGMTLEDAQRLIEAQRVMMDVERDEVRKARLTEMIAVDMGEGPFDHPGLDAALKAIPAVLTEDAIERLAKARVAYVRTDWEIEGY
jgi:hypothetical protein